MYQCTVSLLMYLMTFSYVDSSSRLHHVLALFDQQQPNLAWSTIY